MDHDAVLCGLELRGAWQGMVAFEVIEARDEEVVWRGDGACRASELDHQASSIGVRCVIENDQQIDVGVGPIGAVSHGAEQHDSRRVECGDDRRHEIGTQSWSDRPAHSAWPSRTA